MTNPVTFKVEVQFVPSGAFIDISTRARMVDIVRPRGTVENPTEATTVTVLLDNTPTTAAEATAWGAPAGTAGYVPFTPDNPAGPFSPNLLRDRMVRVTAVWAGGASTSVRFFGWSDTWIPDMSDEVAEATTTLTGSCVMSRYARRDLISDYGEQITAVANQDYWPYDDDTNATYLRGLSLDRTNIPPGQVIPSKDGTGSLSFGKPDGQILVDGAATFARGDGAVTNSPVILHQLRAGAGVTLSRVSMWVRLEGDFTGTADDVCAAYDYYGALVWRLQAAVVAGVVQWRVLDENQVGRSFYTTAYPRDESWHWLSILFFDDAGTPATNLAIRDQTIPDRIVAGYVPGWPRDPSKNCLYLVVGGNMSPRTVGKQSNTLNGSVSGPWVSYQAVTLSKSMYSAANVVFTGYDRVQQMTTYSLPIDTAVGGGVGATAADPTPLMLTGENGNLLDAFREHARSTSGRIITRTDGRREVIVPGATNPIVPVVTLSAESDLHMPAGGWTGEHRELPTRQTVNSPAGSVTVIDSVTEAATGLRLTGSDLSSAAGEVAVARSIAYQQITGGRSRMTSFGVDVTLAGTVSVASMMVIDPWDRIRISGLPTPQLGVSWLDVYASGWQETYVAREQSCVFVFDTDPCDDPPVAYFDDAGYSRFAMGDGASTVTSGTAVGTTAVGTIVNTGEPITNTVGEFPLDLNWNGERVTASGVGGATSPQTITLSARGVAPTVARVHAAGESLEVWFPATFGA
jgi:hypothetical protein